VWLVPVLILLGIAILLLTGGNQPVFGLLNRLSSVTGDDLWASLTILGDTTVALALCLPLARRRPDLLWAVVLAALLATGWVHLLKPFFDVARPPAVLSADAIHVIGPAHRYNSLPSGHATTAFALAGLCVLGFDLRAWSVIPVAAALLIAISRCVVGVHWPLDILAGGLGGWLAAVVGLRVAAQVRLALHPVVQWSITAAFAGCAVALLLDYQTQYPQAVWFQRALGALSLIAWAWSFARRARPAGDDRIR
jgi:membrane-associated phospholipid phosphatase